MAVFVLISVDAYLRPLEAYRLRRADLVAPLAFSQHWGLVVNAEEVGIASKTQEFEDGFLLDSPWIQLLRPVLAVLKEGVQSERIWAFQHHVFVEELRFACKKIAIPRMVPFDMRRSGPSHDRLTNASTLL